MFILFRIKILIEERLILDFVLIIFFIFFGVVIIICIFEERRWSCGGIGILLISNVVFMFGRFCISFFVCFFICI